jgi:hypothetical protein
MFIVFDHPNPASSGGAIYRYPYIAPPELAVETFVETINIRLLRSQVEPVDNRQL